MPYTFGPVVVKRFIAETSFLVKINEKRGGVARNSDFKWQEGYRFPKPR